MLLLVKFVFLGKRVIMTDVTVQKIRNKFNLIFTTPGAGTVFFTPGTIPQSLHLFPATSSQNTGLVPAFRAFSAMETLYKLWPTSLDWCLLGFAIQPEIITIKTFCILTLSLLGSGGPARLLHSFEGDGGGGAVIYPGRGPGSFGPTFGSRRASTCGWRLGGGSGAGRGSSALRRGWGWWPLSW